MAYTSDLRGKNLLTDIDIDARRILDSEDIKYNLEFRVFDESDEDAKPWQDGGICFSDPLTGNTLGSNDAGWFLDGKPLLIVEITFGTERGQFGDGQLNRISHSLGPALNGVYGVTVVPFNGQSFISKGTTPGLVSKNIKYSYGHLHNAMALFGLTISKKESGKYLIMDPYEPDKIRDLLVNLVKDKKGVDNSLQSLTNSILETMSDYLGSFEYGARSNQTIKRVHFTNGEVREDICRYYTHNLESLTTSTKRDGHGLLGKNLIEMYLAQDRSTAIFIRMDNADFDILRKRKSKEFLFISTNPRIDVYNFDDLVFSDSRLKETVKKMRSQNLHTDTEKSLMKIIQKSFNDGSIKLIKH